MKRTMQLFMAFLAIGLLVSCASQGQKVDKPKEEPKEELKPGAHVTEDSKSPTGYTVTFIYKPTEDKELKSVSVSGPFHYIDPEKDLSDAENIFTPHQYKDGMYASSFAPAKGFPDGFNYTEEMTYDEKNQVYKLSFPITSGSFAYSYVLDDGEGEPETIADPANPAPSLTNKNSDFETSEISRSVVYGRYDKKKQSKSPNLDFVLPAEGKKGELTYVEYKGNLSDDQDLGIYLPSGYDDKRAEPYKTIYVSHGCGGNETDWFALGHIDHIMDNLQKDYIVVTMDNSSYKWDFEQIEDNVLNHIIPYMEEHYHVSKEAADRAFCGLSMGSMTTINMLFDYPEEFAYFGSFSGPDMTAVNDNEKVKIPTLYMTVGYTDIASEHILPNDDEAKKKKYEDFIAWEAEHDLPNFIDGGYLKGGHDWFVWSESFRVFVNEVCWQD